ncbi:MAG: MliC family protein [Patescibacteria group bacterium]|nr:MliC family protein [Patescibacteria group bacterium]
MKPKIFFVILIILAAVGIIYYQFLGKTSKKNAQTIQPQPPVQATFNCSAGKTINAVFTDEKVELVLSDNRTIELPQAISASGARYANSDETFVFWNKGDTARIEENGQTTFADCLESSLGK